MVQEGDAFPEFSLPDQDGNVITNEDLKGQKTVVYFYPKDDTPGCTLEACEFRDLTPSYAGARVIGVSPDSPRSHVKFIGKFNLNFTLLSDEKHKLAESCGSWVEKSMLGRTYMGVERSTFLLDEQGKIVKIWRKVKAQGHAQEVVAALG
jgi:thioredoxin-dependent peroxiredoxin